MKPFFPWVLALLAVCAARVESGAGNSLHMDEIVERAIEEDLIAGAVVCFGTRDTVVFEKAYGRTRRGSGGLPLAGDAIFDVASLTKVVATAPVVMRLVETGKVRLDDPLSIWFAEFADARRPVIRVLHLLTHTSGLRDSFLGRSSQPSEVVARAAVSRSSEQPGKEFRYADINFVLLGDIVQRASGVMLDRLAADVIFVPGGMRDTTFTPQTTVLTRCVPTRDANGGYAVGQVQDPNARELGGVAGHAGLFSTAGDLARFCRMMLNSGELDGRRVLSKGAIEEMRSPRASSNGRVKRGLGWDLLSPYATPKGKLFSSSSYGHTGYSGSSIWIDPERNAFVVFLTARNDYSRPRALNELRGSVSDAALEMLGALSVTEEGDGQ